MKTANSVYLRGALYWGGFTVNGKRTQVSLKTNVKKEAVRRLTMLHQTALKEAFVQASTGASPATSDLRLSEALEQMLSEVWSKNRSGDRSYQQILRISEILKDPKLSAISSAKIQKIREVLAADGLSVSTVNRYLAALSTLLYRAQRVWEAIPKVPYIPKGREPEGRLRIVTPEEEAQLLALVPPLMADYLSVLVNTGLRASEGRDIGGLVEVSGDYLVVTAAIAKSKKTRRIPMNPKVREVLKRHPRGFTGRISKDYLRFHWNTAKAAMGLSDDPEFVPHALRHTFCSRLVQAGASLSAVQKLAGHASLLTTERYIHLRDSDLVDAVHLLVVKPNSPTTSKDTSHA